MSRRSYYSSVSRAKRPASHIVAIIFGIILALLIAFIVWAAVVFGNGGEGVFQNHTREISELKMQVYEKDIMIAELLEELGKYRGHGVEQSGEAFGPMPATPEPVLPETTGTGVNQPARQTSPVQQPEPPPADTQSATDPQENPPPEQEPNPDINGNGSEPDADIAD